MDDIGLSNLRFIDYLWKHNNAGTGEIKKGKDVVGIFHPKPNSIQYFFGLSILTRRLS